MVLIEKLERNLEKAKDDPSLQSPYQKALRAIQKEFIPQDAQKKRDLKNLAKKKVMSEQEARKRISEALREE